MTTVRRAPKWRSKLLAVDAVTTGTQGLRGRKGRTFMTAIGIAIGIASMVAVLGISQARHEPAPNPTWQQPRR